MRKAIAGLLIALAVVLVVVFVILPEPTPTSTGELDAESASEAATDSEIGIESFTLSTSVEPSEAGSVSPASGEYEEGTTVSLTATPASGYTFDYWQGDASASSASVTITMDSDKSIVARFSVVEEKPSGIQLEFAPAYLPITHDIQFTAVDETNVSWTSGTITAAQGSEFSVSAGSFRLDSADTYYLYYQVGDPDLRHTQVFSDTTPAERFLIVTVRVASPRASISGK